MSPEDTISEYGDYMICYPDTGDLIHAIAKDGPDGGLEVIDLKKQEFEEMINGTYESNPYANFTVDDLDKMMDNLFGKGGQTP